MSIFSKSLNNLYLKREKDLESEWRSGFLSMLDENPNARMLDLGCNQGNLTLLSVKKIGTKLVIGMDALEEVKTDVEQKGITFCKGDLNENLPFKDSSFDVVCASQVIEHISNTDRFFQEIRRVLIDGGYAVISTPNLAAVHTIITLMLGWQPASAHVSDEASWAGTWVRGEKQDPFMKHRRLFTLRALCDLSEYYGFKVEKTIGSGFILFPANLSRFVCHIDKSHANIITVKVRKTLVESS